MNEIVFLVEEATEGGYIARALNEDIFTEADDVATLRESVKDAVKCHFNDGVQRIIRLHFTREEVFAA